MSDDETVHRSVNAERACPLSVRLGQDARRVVLVLAAATTALFLQAEQVRAQDGAYGRLDGDLAFEVGAGGGVTFEGENVSGAGTLSLRARYLDVAGLMVAADLRPDRQPRLDGGPGGGDSRVIVALDVRPLWLARFFLGASFGDRWLDLFVDSLGVDLGVAITPLDERVGAALAIGFGVDLPLVFFGRGVEGLALRVHGRHVASLETDRFGPDTARNDWLLGAALVVRWHASTGLTSWERPRYRTRPR